MIRDGCKAAASLPTHTLPCQHNTKLYALPLSTTPSMVLFKAPSFQPTTHRHRLSREEHLSARGNDDANNTCIFPALSRSRPLDRGGMLQLLPGRRRGFPVLVAAMAVAVLSAASPVDAYKNYTVGDDKGWYDGLAVDYQAWAEGYNFTLGDFLIFNTDKNHSVVQTRNETVYKSCDYDDAGPEDTVDWSAAPEFSKDAVTAAVPLLKEGKTYFFSGNYDGEQCENGQRFAIAVAHGQGLPPDLRPPAADAPGPAPGPYSADSKPAFDFSHPKNVPTPSDTAASDDDDPSSSTSGSSLTLAGLRPGLMIMALAVLFVLSV